MNAKQIKKTKKTRKVIKHLDDNIEIVKKVPAFFGLFGDLKTNAMAIEITGGRQQQNRTGFSRDKEKVRQWLEEETFEISSALCSLAAINKNNTLEKLVYCTPSWMDGQSHDDILIFSRTVLQEAEDNKDALVDHAVTGEKIATYKLLVEEFDGVIEAPEMAGDFRKAQSDALVALFKENDELHKKKMLPAARVFRKTDPEFYATYLLCLRTPDPRTVNSQAAGFIRNKVTGNVLRGATIRAEGTAYKTISDNKGKYRLKIPESGFYTLVIELEGYETLRITEAEISLGKILSLDIELKPLF